MEYKDIQYLKGCFNKAIPSVFDPALSYDEQVRMCIYAVNQLIENDKYFKNILDEFLNAFNANLETVVEKILTQWKNNGQLDEIFERLIPDSVYVANPEMIPSTAGLILSFYGPDKRNGMLYKTLDGLHFTPIFKMPDNISWGNTCLWYKDDYWYAGIFSNAPGPGPGNNLLSFLVSKDLYKWETINVPYTPVEIEIWSNPGNFFVYNEELYYCFYGYTSGNVRTNHLCKITLDQNNIKINDLKEITGFPSTDYFDPFIYCDGPNKLIFVKEDTDTGKIWKYTINIEDATVTNPQVESQFNKGDVGQCEAPSYNVDDYGNTYLYADDFRSGFVTHPYGGMVVSVNGETPADINSYSRPMRAGIFLKLRNCPQALVAINQFLPATIAPIQVGTADNDVISGETLNAYTGDDNVYLTNNNPTITNIANKPGSLKFIVPKYNSVTFKSGGNIILPDQASEVTFLSRDSEKMITVSPLPERGLYYLEVRPTIQYPNAIEPNRKVLYLGNQILDGTGTETGGIYGRTNYMFGISEKKSVNNASILGGSGGVTIRSVFDSWLSTKTDVDKKSFTDVVIVTSYLDALSLNTTSNINLMISEANTLCGWIHTNLPNANIHLFNAGCSCNINSTTLPDFYACCLLHQTLIKCSEQVPNMVYHGWIGWAIEQDETQFQADKLWPNDSGYYWLGDAFVNGWYGCMNYKIKAINSKKQSSSIRVQIARMFLTPELFTFVTRFTTTEQLNQRDFLILMPRTYQDYEFLNVYNVNYLVSLNQNNGLICPRDTPTNTIFDLSGTVCLLRPLQL